MAAAAAFVTPDERQLVCNCTDAFLGGNYLAIIWNRFPVVKVLRRGIGASINSGNGGSGGREGERNLREGGGRGEGEAGRGGGWREMLTRRGRGGERKRAGEREEDNERERARDKSVPGDAMTVVATG